MSFIELEELVGKAWHRWAGDAPSYPRHADAAVRLDDLRGSLPVFFRGLGGVAAARLSSGSDESSKHRLTFRQRLGLSGEEPMPQAHLNAERLLLPEVIDCLPGRTLNRDLYYWLAAYLAHARDPGPAPEDPLQADVAVLIEARASTCRVLDDWPGLRATHARLCAALRDVRPVRELPQWEAGVESCITHLLGGPPPECKAGRDLWAAIELAEPQGLRAPRDYRTFLPVPLWGRVSAADRAPAVARDDDAGDTAGESAESASDRRLKARRTLSDQADRRDPLLLNRFEYLLSIAEMLNLNRTVEDDEPGNARKAAESLEELSIGQTDRRAASRLKAELELAPAEVDDGVLAGEFTYPEWDFTTGHYRDDHCRVIAKTAPNHRAGADDWRPDREARKRIRQVRRQFEALRPRHRLCPAQADGDDLDLNAVIRTRADLAATGVASDRLYQQSRNVLRDFAVTVLLDASLSTDSWVGNRRVLDVEKEAVLALSQGLAACGDDHGVLAFSSRTRRHVSVDVLKAFDEPPGALTRRLSVLTPGHYTRIGAALRHAAAGLEKRGNRHRLLLLLTDGKPNDSDHYEGRFGIEDTRKAVQEARRAGLLVFGITVDSRAREYFPYLFGPGGYAVVSRLARLPLALPLLYRQITA